MNLAHTALLVMDMQASITGMYPDKAPAVIAAISAAIAHARKNNLPVIYAVVGFRNGMPEVSASNKTFNANKERVGSADLSGMTAVLPQLAPLETDVVVVKRRYSAFTGSDLDVVLRSMEIRHLVLTGIATSGVVLSTLCEASDKDYTITVLADCCTDGDDTVHEVLTTKVFPKRAAVTTLAGWTQ